MYTTIHKFAVNKIFLFLHVTFGPLSGWKKQNCTHFAEKNCASALRDYADEYGSLS